MKWIDIACSPSESHHWSYLCLFYFTFATSAQIHSFCARDLFFIFCLLLSTVIQLFYWNAIFGFNGGGLSSLSCCADCCIKFIFSGKSVESNNIIFDFRCIFEPGWSKMIFALLHIATVRDDFKSKLHTWKINWNHCSLLDRTAGWLPYKHKKLSNTSWEWIKGNIFSYRHE